MIKNVKHHPYRSLDLVDVMLFVLISEGKSAKEACAELNLCASALSHRFRKHESVFEYPIYTSRGRVRLTKMGLKFAKKAKKVIEILASGDDIES